MQIFKGVIIISRRVLAKDLRGVKEIMGPLKEGGMKEIGQPLIKGEGDKNQQVSSG